MSAQKKRFCKPRLGHWPVMTFIVTGFPNFFLSLGDLLSQPVPKTFGKEAKFFTRHFKLGQTRVVKHTMVNGEWVFADDAFLSLGKGNLVLRQLKETRNNKLTIIASSFFTIR